MNTRKTMNPEDIEKQNQYLVDISKTIFGDTAELRIVNPKSLVLLTQNARYFKRETFKQLAENIKNDKRLSSVPLCHILEDGRIEVLSGNHRIKAAIQAEIPSVVVIVLLEPISKTKKISIQLSHNALVGEDDAQILSELWARIDDIKERLYAGLSSDKINELKKIELVTFTTPQVYTKSVTFAFTDSEKENLEKVINELTTLSLNEIYIAPKEQFNDFFRALQEVKKLHNIKNGSLAMLKLIEIAEKEINKGEQCHLSEQ